MLLLPLLDRRTQLYCAASKLRDQLTALTTPPLRRVPPQVNVMGSIIFAVGILFAIANSVVSRRRAA